MSLALLAAGATAFGALPPKLWEEGPPPGEIRLFLQSLDGATGDLAEDRVRASMLLMKRLYETKAPFWQQLAAVKELKSWVDGLSRQSPTTPRTWALQGEMFSYVPSFLGGDLDRAQALFEKSLAASPDTETLYKAAVFFLNTRYRPGEGVHDPSALKLAENLLIRLENLGDPLPSQGGALYAWRWAPYQLAVCAFEGGRDAPCLSNLEVHRRRCPQSYWGPYQAWKVMNRDPVHFSASPWGDITATRLACESQARAQGDLVFLDRLATETRQNR